MRACKVDEKQLVEWINDATGAVRYLGPAITDKVAQAMLAAEKRTGQRNHIVIDLDDEMDRSGYGQTTAVRTLHDEGAGIRYRHGLGIAALATPRFSAVWSPVAERVDSMDRISVNGIRMDGAEQQEFLCWISRMMGEQEATPSTEGDDQKNTISDPQTSDETCRIDPVEPDVEINDVEEEELNKIETHLREHPPRNFKEEKELDVYTGYVGFIEIHVTGAGLDKATTLAIPKELTELNLGNEDLRSTLTEKMRIDLSEGVNLGVSEVNRRMDAFKEIFTKQIGQPLGRIYKKSDWTVMNEKWAEIELLVEAANTRIKRSMEQAIQKNIEAAAESWAKALEEMLYRRNRDPRTLDFDPTYEGIRSLLLSQWDQRKRTTEVKIQLFAKDLTWDTLNNENVRRTIEYEYPDLRKTGLYKSRQAWSD